MDFHETFVTGERRLRDGEYGRKRVGFFCINTPEELIYAAGALPVRILSHQVPVSRANTYVQTSVCSYARSCLERFLTGELAYLDAVVISHSCDIIVKMRDFLEDALDLPLYFLNNPHVPSRGAREFFGQEIRRFMGWLEDLTGQMVSAAGLRASIGLYNRHRALLKEIYIRRARGTELGLTPYLEAILSGFSMLKDLHNQLLEDFLASPEKASSPARGLPVYLSGSILEDLGFACLLDKVGLQVVADDLCTGSRYFWSQVEGDDLDSLIERYFTALPCPRLHASDRRLAFIEETAVGTTLDGAIINNLSCCDAHQFERRKIEQYFGERGVPVLYLETSYENLQEQLRTRLEAFNLDPASKS